MPAGHDASLGLTIGDPAVPRSGGHYRALIFVNGWNMGQYIADVGPQHTFVLPTGILNPNGRNTLALAVTSDGGAGNALEKVRADQPRHGSRRRAGQAGGLPPLRRAAAEAGQMTS